MDKNALLTESLDQEEVPVRGGAVVVRGLSWFEVALSGKGTDDSARIGQRMLHMAMIDPVMSEEDVARWQKTPGSAGDIGRVMNRVNALSGIGKEAQKEAFFAFRGEPEPGV